jgi:hypothetical protein
MPVVDTTTPFSNNEQITSTKLNNIMDNSLFVAGAVVSGQGLEVTAGGQMQIQNAGITPEKLSNSDFGDFTVSGGVATIDNGVVTPAKLSQPLTSATAQNTTSGTSIDFTGIPSWVKRITVMLNGISGNGSSSPIIQLGDSGGIENSGYAGSIGYSGAESGAAAFSSGFLFNLGVGAVTTTSGVATLLNISGNVWIYAISAAYADQAYSLSGGGTKTLSATLDRIRITTVNGTDTFDAGSVNIMYE